MLGSGAFWDAYFHTFTLSASAAAITSMLAFPCAYAIAFKMSETARRWAIFLMIIPFFTSYRSEEHTSELQSLMRISYAVFCLKKKNHDNEMINHTTHTQS